LVTLPGCPPQFGPLNLDVWAGNDSQLGPTARGCFHNDDGFMLSLIDDDFLSDTSGQA
jgi:hypothetical protein